MNPIRLAVFASGTGTNTDAIIQHLALEPSIEVALVVTNKPDAGVIQVAERHGVDVAIVTKSDLSDDELVLSLFDGYEIDVIILAGWLLLVPPYLVQAFEGRMLNIHPALLPKFGGKGMWGHHVHEAVKAAGESESGISIHFVNEKFDEGALWAQYRVALTPEDDAQAIEAKVRALELRHYPEEVKKFCLSLSTARS